MSQISLEPIFLEQLRNIIDSYNRIKDKTREKDLFQFQQELTSILVKARAAVERVSGTESPYSKQLQVYADLYKGNLQICVRHVMGVVDALVADLENGYLKSVLELLHAEVFADYLSMADHLLAEGFKDAAAVLAGGTLEAHLKQLCSKYDIETVFIDGKGNLRNKAADVLNSDLVKVGAYTKQDQKNVTAWLGLRNDAAHANYDSYGEQQVRLLVASVRDFIGRVPA